MTTPIDTMHLRALLEGTTPGPWAWYGNTRMTDVYLATVRGGRNYVMDFVRWGMRGAQPRFNVGGIMHTVKELVTGEHFAIDHPDARFIAAMDPTTVRALLDEVERLRALVAPPVEGETEPRKVVINEAGEGAFNVLALMDLYQNQITEADERAALAYPRALQAAADVVLVAPAPAEVDEADWLAYQDDLANVILELSAEQIDACDAKVEEAAQVAEHYVCPGCHVVDEEPCLPGCIDAEIEGERRTPFDGFSEFMADDEGDESEEGGDHG